MDHIPRRRLQPARIRPPSPVTPCKGHRLDPLRRVPGVGRLQIVMAQFKRLADREPAKAARLEADLDFLREVAVEQEQRQAAGFVGNRRESSDTARCGTGKSVRGCRGDRNRTNCRSRTRPGRAAPCRGRTGSSARTGRRWSAATPAPPVSVMIGAITLTSCARQAVLTRSAWLSSEMQAPPKASASSMV